MPECVPAADRRDPARRSRSRAESWFGGIYHDVNDQFPNLAVDPDTAEAMWPDWGVSPEQSWKNFEKLAHRVPGRSRTR